MTVGAIKYANPNWDQTCLADLAESKLQPQDLNARMVSPSELAVTRTPPTVKGYVIPYYDMDGKPLPFYRIKLIDHDPKYKQPKNSGNFLYYPIGFKKAVQAAIARGNRTIFITEGEKKATCATRHGFPCVGLGGVDSWRTRVLILPEDTTLERNLGAKKSIKAKLPSTDASIIEKSSVATGFQELIDFSIQQHLTVVICFDSDGLGALKPEVQRAAAYLGYELRFKGVPTKRIKQLILPQEVAGEKVGLDDFLIKHPDKLQPLLAAVLKDLRAFPRHPNPKGFITSRLDKQGGLSRNDLQEVSLAILFELDFRGRRLRDKYTGLPYFYDEASFKLMPAILNNPKEGPIHESAFGSYLYREFGLSAADNRIITWLASQFTGEDPITPVVPRRVMCLTPDDPLNPDGIAFQISDSEYVKVYPDPKQPIRLLQNGSEGMLFEQEQVVPLDSELMLQHFHEEIKRKDFKPWWLDVSKEMNFVNPQCAHFAALLYYISPWLLRWRGMQLPIELTYGEPGSGKSSLYMVRLMILSGIARLRNLPNDLRDWYAGIANCGGLHVTDNVNFTNKELRQRISDELCRVTTEPAPFIEMRKLFTTTGTMKIPVTNVFAMTALQQPFLNADLIQRAALFNVQNLETEQDGDWVAKQIDRFGGREAWVGHHLAFLHRFFKAAQTEWDPDYKSTHRLAQYEQALLLAAKIFGIKADWLPSMMQGVLDEILVDSDWTLEGIKRYVDEVAVKQGEKWKFSAGDISDWASLHPEFEKNPILPNVRALGRYMIAHLTTVKKVCRMRALGKYGNRQVYTFWAPAAGQGGKQR
jgi:hypothetical protein